MNRRQKSVIINFVIVAIVTTLFAVVMTNVKDFVNKSEGLRAMTLLAEHIQEYRKEYKSLPPESHLNRIKNQLKLLRLGQLQYRAQWISFGAEPDTILAYSQKNYPFLVGKGSIVMRLDGTVEWMDKPEFEELLGKQQSSVEIELLSEPMEF